MSGLWRLASPGTAGSLCTAALRTAGWARAASASSLSPRTEAHSALRFFEVGCGGGDLRASAQPPWGRGGGGAPSRPWTGQREFSDKARRPDSVWRG